MSRKTNLSVIGLYGYDNTLFDLFTLPAGIDKEILITNICSQLAELEVLYPNPEVMKTLIGVWSHSCQYEWKKLLDTMEVEYNPIDNYDRTETRTLDSSGSGNSQDSGSDTSSANGTNKVAGFNSGTNLADREKTETTAQTNYGKKTNEAFTKKDIETIHARGNIGVTTTQQMLTQEREIANFNIYDIITEEFKQRFCILVY